jgi:Cell shape-determining protein
MKMTFQIKPTKHNSFGSNLLKIFIIFLTVLLFVLTVSFSRGAQSLISDFFYPFLKGGDYFYKSLGLVPKFFTDRNKIIDENQNLLDQIENDRLDLIDYQSIKYENQKLREELGLKPVGNYITASIIGRSPQIPLDSLFLDKGISDGLANGDLVLSGERILIGKIVKVSKNRATVVLNSSATEVSYGYVARTSEPLEIKGDGGGSIRSKVSIDFDIMVGDKIMTGGSLQFITAVVGSIEEDRSSGFKNVLMSLPVDISKINVVFVMPAIGE